MRRSRASSGWSTPTPSRSPGPCSPLFVYASIYLQDVLGLSPVRTGLALLPATTVIFVVSGLTAQFQARVSARMLLTAGLALVSVGMLALLLATESSSWVMTLPGLGALIPAAGARGVMDKAAFVAGLHHATLVAALVAAVGAAATGWLVDRNLRSADEDAVPVGDAAVTSEVEAALV
jgi:hypothetical protein